uniref:Uncharacterized protein n=1 Tax=Cacopsylla melanoneura TaxID=428564 RepID=A0A8D8LHH7_9HEMI
MSPWKKCLKSFGNLLYASCTQDLPIVKENTLSRGNKISNANFSIIIRLLFGFSTSCLSNSGPISILSIKVEPVQTSNTNRTPTPPQGIYGDGLISPPSLNSNVLPINKPPHPSTQT